MVMRTEPRPGPCNVQFVAYRRATDRRYGWPKKTGDSFDVRDFWRQLANLCHTLDCPLGEFDVQAFRRPDPSHPWAADAALTADLEAGRPAVRA